jgi:hypothetical protein
VYSELSVLVPPKGERIGVLAQNPFGFCRRHRSRLLHAKGDKIIDLKKGRWPFLASFCA